MTDNILIPLDGSPLAEAALHYVGKWCAKMNPAMMPTITLMQVIRNPNYSYVGDDEVYSSVIDSPESEQKTKQVLGYLEGVADTLRQQGVSVNCMVVIGEEGVSSAAGIIKVEERTGADLVVMSTHGRRGITRWAFGSVAEKVLRSGSVPVLMVRAK